MLLMDECMGLMNALDSQSWFDALIGAANRIGYPNVLYGLKANKASKNEEAIILSNFPRHWRTTYDHQRYALIDPTVSHSFTSSAPLLWTPALYRSEQQQQFGEEAQCVGLTHGITLPIHGPQGQIGMLSLSCHSMPEAEYTQTIDHTLGAATMLRDYAIESGSRHLFAHSTPQRPCLTAREKEILHWAWADKTTWEIGKILGLSGPTVEFHFKNIRKKLDVTSRRLAVARAIQLDILAV